MENDTPKPILIALLDEVFSCTLVRCRRLTNRYAPSPSEVKSGVSTTLGPISFLALALSFQVNSLVLALILLKQLNLSGIAHMALFTNVVEMMGALPPKYEPLNSQQDDEATQQDSLIPNFPRDGRTLRLKIIRLGFCLGVLVATFLIQVVVGLILNSIVMHIYPTA